MKKLNNILEKLQAASDFVMPEAPSGPYIFDVGTGGAAGGGGGNPLPCPASPTSIPNECEREASEVAACLETLQTGTIADQDTAKLLKSIVGGWGKNRCPALKSVCYHAANGNFSCYPNMNQTDLNCFCRVHSEYWKGLKGIVSAFCQGTMNADAVKNALNNLCKQLKLAVLRCKGSDGKPDDPVVKELIGSLSCGIERVL